MSTTTETMNLSMGTTPRPGYTVELLDNSWETTGGRWVTAFTVEVAGFGGEDMDGEPFFRSVEFNSHAVARAAANTAHRLMLHGTPADEAFAAALDAASYASEQVA